MAGAGIIVFMSTVIRSFVPSDTAAVVGVRQERRLITSRLIRHRMVVGVAQVGDFLMSNS